MGEGTCIQSVILILEGRAREDCQLVLRDSNVKKGLRPLLPPPHSGTCCRGKISSLENWRGRNLALVWLVSKLDGNEGGKLHTIHQICLLCQKLCALQLYRGQKFFFLQLIINCYVLKNTSFTAP
jgi:hypothetical protein